MTWTHETPLTPSWETEDAVEATWGRGCTILQATAIANYAVAGCMLAGKTITDWVEEAEI